MVSLGLTQALRVGQLKYTVPTQESHHPNPDRSVEVSDFRENISPRPAACWEHLRLVELVVAIVANPWCSTLVPN